MRLPDGSGGELCKRAKAQCPNTRFVILTSFCNELNLSEKTVKKYLANAMQKLQVSRRTEAVAFFMRYQEAEAKARPVDKLSHLGFPQRH